MKLRSFIGASNSCGKMFVLPFITQVNISREDVTKSCQNPLTFKDHWSSFTLKPVVLTQKRPRCTETSKYLNHWIQNMEIFESVPCNIFLASTFEWKLGSDVLHACTYQAIWGLAREEYLNSERAADRKLLLVKLHYHLPPVGKWGFSMSTSTLWCSFFFFLNSWCAAGYQVWSLSVKGPVM